MNGSHGAQEPVLATVARPYNAQIQGMKQFDAFQCESKKVTDTQDES
jgi:hypothetical protein